MAILVTGFEPNDDGLNASKVLVESLLPPLPVQAQKQWLATPFIPLNMARDALALVLVALADLD
ncbi:MAG: hypothetical protein V4563_11330 [Pseudomonadota bacterium]